MKKLLYPSLVLLSIFFMTSSAVKSSESNRLFEKIIFVEISINEDSVLFKPYSKAWDERWEYSTDINYNGTPLMDYDMYKVSFKNRMDNLWTILHPLVIDGTIKSYWPYNPETFGLGTWDDGELRYPLVGEGENGTFLTSDTVRENLCIMLGRFGPQSDIPLVNEYGDNIIVDLPDGTQEFAYAAPDYYWYADEDITHYKLRVSILVNKNGKEKKRVIKSISPMFTQTTDSGSIIGNQEIIWLDFEEVEPYLKKAYYVDDNWKPVTYFNHILQKVDSAIVKQKG